MQEELLDIAPLRLRVHAGKAHANMAALMGYMEASGRPRDRLLRLVSNPGKSTFQARSQWVALVCAYARDHYADAGFQALGWTQALLDATQLLRMLAQEDARASARHEWQIRTPWATIDHGPASAVIPSSSPPASGVSLRVLEMEDVIRESRGLSRKNWCQLTRVAAKWLVAAQPPAIALATGALGALVLGGRLTHCEHLHLGGEPLDWHLHVRWLDPEAGIGPTGEDMTGEWPEEVLEYR